MMKSRQKCHLIHAESVGATKMRDSNLKQVVASIVNTLKQLSEPKLGGEIVCFLGLFSFSSDLLTFSFPTTFENKVEVRSCEIYCNNSKVFETLEGTESSGLIAVDLKHRHVLDKSFRLILKYTVTDRRRSNDFESIYHFRVSQIAV